MSEGLALDDECPLIVIPLCTPLIGMWDRVWVATGPLEDEFVGRAGPNGCDIMFLMSESKLLESVSSEEPPFMTLDVEPVLVDRLRVTAK